MKCKVCKKEYKRKDMYVKHIATHETKIDSELDKKKKALQDLEDKITGATEFCTPKIRAIIDEVLGKEFKANMKARETVPQFELTIYVPLEYSSLSKEEIKMHGNCDPRFVVVNFAEAEPKTREYCQLVKQNIKQDMITAKGIKQPT